MPAPTVTIPTTGTDPKRTTREQIEAAINAALASLDSDLGTRATAAALAAEAAARESVDADQAAAIGATGDRLARAETLLPITVRVTGVSGAEVACEVLGAYQPASLPEISKVT
uniref:hypothetical protein n=1 Tax=Oceanicella sp. SM1341 TaxID=1548889 RepID=UPI0013002590